MAARPPLSLKARALQWLAQREHSRSELRRKLMTAAGGAMRWPRGAAADARAADATAERYRTRAALDAPPKSTRCSTGWPPSVT